MMNSQAWIVAYEDWNVDHGFACGLSGRARMFQGMYAVVTETLPRMTHRGGQVAEAGLAALAS